MILKQQKNKLEINNISGFEFFQFSFLNSFLLNNSYPVQIYGCGAEKSIFVKSLSSAILILFSLINYAYIVVKFSAVNGIPAN